MMLLFATTTHSQNMNNNIVVLNKIDTNRTEFLPEEIDSITFDESNRQVVWTKDSIYKLPIYMLDSTTFEKFEVPDVVVINENIGDWSELRIAKDGSIQMLKNEVGKESPKEVFMILPTKDDGVVLSNSTFDDNGMPKSITINDCIIIVDAYYDNYMDLTIAYNDTIAYSVDSIMTNISDVRMGTRQVEPEHNWQRKCLLCIDLAIGLGKTLTGGFLIYCSVAAEAPTLGLSSVISIPGIAAGYSTCSSGLEKMTLAYNALKSPESYKTPQIAKKIGAKICTDVITYNLKSTDEDIEYIINEKYRIIFNRTPDHDLYKKASLVDNCLFAAEVATDITNVKWGKTITWNNIRQSYDKKVLTGICQDKTQKSAMIKGYISPSITNCDNEYGIVVCSATEVEDRHIEKVTNGDGGLLEYTFKNLKPATTYNYRTYFTDRKNGLNVLQNSKSFRTLSASVAEIEQVSVESIGNGKIKFKANVKLDSIVKEMEDIEDVEYGFGIYCNKELVDHYSLDSLNEVKEIEIICDKNNVKIDWNNFEATTEEYWTLAVSIRYDYKSIIHFTDEMQDIILTYKEKPSLTFTRASILNTIATNKPQNIRTMNNQLGIVAPENDEEVITYETDYCFRCKAVGTFWFDNVQLTNLYSDIWKNFWPSLELSEGDGTYIFYGKMNYDSNVSMDDIHSFHIQLNDESYIESGHNLLIGGVPQKPTIVVNSYGVNQKAVRQNARPSSGNAMLRFVKMEKK